MPHGVLGEFLGTMVLILLGNGVVAGVLLRKSKAENAGWIAITAGWAFGVMAGVFTAIACGSEGHLNPAVTIGAAIVSGDFSKVTWYIVAQMAGAFVGACLVWLHYLPHWYETVSYTHLDVYKRQKWTTYRHMAEDCVNQAATLARLPEKPCVTEHLNIHGFHPSSEKFGRLWMYGTDAPLIQQIESDNPEWAEPLDRELPYTAGEVIWAVREEMARTVEDVLARRTRALFLNSQAALRAAPRVARLMAAELKQDDAWEAEQLDNFRRTAANYVVV